PDLAQFLEKLEPQHRGRLLQDLIPLDVEARRRAGEAPSPQDYVARFPDYTANIDHAFAEMQDTPVQEPPTEMTTPPTPRENAGAVKDFL
ncbi:MAG: hypothetical protein GTO03_05000, partial [Planctomycetales bacterium]|nr:hypothetical protein [Planctomycetales bacterium]